MYHKTTVGSVIDDWLAGYPADTTDLSDEHRELVRELVKFMVQNTDRRSARID